MNDRPKTGNYNCLMMFDIVSYVFAFLVAFCMRERTAKDWTWWFVYALLLFVVSLYFLFLYTWTGGQNLDIVIFEWVFDACFVVPLHSLLFLYARAGCQTNWKYLPQQSTLIAVMHVLLLICYGYDMGVYEIIWHLFTRQALPGLLAT